ncbi:Bug family tripartite tricarboxylate transporter substrate binding protein [Zwartia panacis]|uniref:Bug family tripartite tricarboxylate transporter substrate binding protein n=1 Tax=Zwartia panacis TaxID=2683345 RepID=UPI0025B43BE3|nr:tripartite tricarboxylate transporter substrate binding protein [Zwartia panacis]MDN4018147.1 tripartite tricarboxylate transporter substrate binding protein [Zwartia panacis]
MKKISVTTAALLASALVILSVISGGVRAQTSSFPNRPIKIVVPFVPGGGSDSVARVIAKGMTEHLGQPVIVENRGGANTIIGTEYVAKSAPDGYTLLVCTTAFATNPSMYKLPFDTVKDFDPVTMYLGAALVLVINPNIPVNNVRELIALAKAQPGKLTFASYGAGGPGHLAGELFKQMAGVDMLHIPYKGSSPSIADVVSGTASMSFAVLQPALPLIKAGKLRALGVVMAERASQLPDVPTIGETLPGFLITGFNGLCAPAGTPPAVLKTLNDAITKVVTTPDIRDQLVSAGNPVLDRPLPPKEFAEFVKVDIERWRKIVTDGNVTLK